LFSPRCSGIPPRSLQSRPRPRTTALGWRAVTQSLTDEDAVVRATHRAYRPRYLLRVLGVTAAAEFRLKYSGSALGYFWSIAKPLAFFTMLYFVFGHVFKLNSLSPYYPVSLLIGIV